MTDTRNTEQMTGIVRSNITEKIEFTRPPGPPDYLPIVDPDIREIFAGKDGYFLSDILYAQIIKELRKLNEYLNPKKK